LYTLDVMKKCGQSIKEQAKQLAANTEAELAELLGMRADLDKEIVRLRQVLKGLQPVLDDNYKAGRSNKRPSIKQMCIEILQTSYEALTATEIVNELKERRFPVVYEKPIAVVSITLKRLVDKGEATEEKKAGRAAYKLKGSGEQLKLSDQPGLRGVNDSK
jgi:hypothetical protein